MKKISVFIILLVLLAVSAFLTYSFIGKEPSGKWTLVWSDEFNGEKVDSSKWNILIRENSKHNELQYYVPDEVYIYNGMLRIQSRVRTYGSKAFTSGRLDTRSKFAPVYGRFEIRAKLPGGKGLWPAHWLYPQYHDIDYVRYYRKTGK